jgi:predicted transcriptional regulator
MARPKKGEEKGATMHLGVRVSPQLRDRLDTLAAKHKRSITDEVRAALESYAGLATDGAQAKRTDATLGKKRRA